MRIEQSSLARRLALFATSVCAPALAGQANAQDFETDNLPQVANQACAEVARSPKGQIQPGDLAFEDGHWRAIPANRVGFFLMAFAGETPSSDGPMHDLAKLRSDPDWSGKHSELYDTVDQFQLGLAVGKYAGLKAFRADGKPIKASEVNPATNWFAGPGITLHCLVPTKPEAEGGSKLSIRLRGNVDALPATGTELKSADAAVIGYNRTRTFEDDGSRKQTNEVSINAVLGAVKEVNDNFAVTGYVGYELKRSRVKPTPSLVPPATERDGDTDIVTLGVMGEAYIPLGGKDSTGSDDQQWSTSLRLTFGSSYVFDRVKDSERVRGELTAGLFHREKIDVTLAERKKRKPLLGICDLGGYSHIAPNVWTRCDVQAMVTYNQVTRQGSLTPSGNDQFGHAGGKVSASLYLGDPSKKSSFFFGADYVYQVRYAGDPNEIPDIRRHSVTLGHRWWQSKGFAIEIKASLTDGINPDSFADENALTLGFGVIF